MKKTVPLLLLCLLLSFCAKAQYVTLPDTVFANWLQTHGYASCMNGNSLDTTCAKNIPVFYNEMLCYGLPIRNLTGIQYFEHALYIDCSNDSLYSLPVLPPYLRGLNCGFNHLDTLPQLPPGLLDINCWYNSISRLPVFNNTVITINCMGNFLTSLPVLPDSLQTLWCSNNNLTTLPTLPAALKELRCNEDSMIALPALPATLQHLECNTNAITTLPALPASLTYLDCSINLISLLPALPDSLLTLRCENCNLHALPALPNSITQLWCDFNSISVLPSLPTALTDFACGENLLSSMPTLPSHIKSFYCEDNFLTSLPLLPDSITYLECSRNLLTWLPDLPDSLHVFDCSYNFNLTCLPQLKKIDQLFFDSTAITCLPDYGTVLISSPLLNTLPLCGIFNPSGCTPYWNISGTVFYDANNDCNLDSNDVGTNYVKTQLYNGGVLQQQTYTGGLGEYSFLAPAYGNYTVVADTSDIPFTISCPDSGYLATTLSATDSLSYSNNFALKCRTQGFDLGLHSIIYSGAIPRPAAVVTINTIAGDIAQLYGAHCATGVSGQVITTFSGSITYVSPAAGALTPSSVTGNTITWNVADFGTIDNNTAFNVVFRIDNSAIPGTQVCYTVTITPVAGDYNAGNNTRSYCFTIVNALDPNEKEVYPTKIEQAGDWLTYTIRFQNTGTAPALNVRVTDTLDNNLDVSTFQLLTYSAKNLTQVFGNAVVFNFPNINLPDSGTDQIASRGYVQFRIKTKGNISLGSTVSNTASIYFDLNPAVVTNTVVDTFVTPTGINSYPANNGILVNAFPNPFTETVTIFVSGITGEFNFELYDVTGRLQKTISRVDSDPFQVSRSNLSAGVYFYRIVTNNAQLAYGKLVIESH